VTVVAVVDTDERYGIGVRTGNTALRDALNVALADVVASGAYQDIYTRWFPTAGDAQAQAEAITQAPRPGDLGDPSRYGLRQQGRMIVGSDIAFKPFEFVEDGEDKGFDIDLMRALGDRLGLRVEFVNNPFDSIFVQLAGGQFDAIISGITITDEREQSIDFTNPYFLAKQGLAVLGGSGIRGVGDLAGKRVAVQATTTGELYAQTNFASMGATVASFPTSEAAFSALRANQVDAVFIDLPVARDAEAAQLSGGGVNRLIEQYFDVRRMLSALPPLLGEGLLNTLYLAVGASAVGLAAGLLLSLVTISRRWWLRLPARAYVDVFRGLPAILTIALVGLGLPTAGLSLFGREGRLYAILALGLISTAYVAEIFRAGIQSIDPGQMEAARSVGMSYGMAMRLVIVPQAVRRVLPALTNEFIAITKDTSLAFILGISIGDRDLFRVGQNVSQQSFNFSPLVAAGLMYLLITVPLTRVVNALDTRLREGRSATAAGALPTIAGSQEV
jgi:His/Glu/Gln/Arg/opine family amino acid ABC transporter permease subunit